MNGRLLIVDHDESSRRMIEAALVGEGLDVSIADDAATVPQRLRSDRPDLVLLGVNSTAGDGLEVFDRLKASDPAMPVVVLVGASDSKTATRAVRSGAKQYVTKPIDREELVFVVHRALEEQALRTEVETLRQRVASMGSAGSSGDTEGVPTSIRPPSPGLSLRAAAEEAARGAEHQAIVRALEVSKGNKSQAAKALKTDYKTLHIKMKALKIRAADFKPH